MSEIYRSPDQLLNRLPIDLASVYKKYNTPDSLQWYLTNQLKYQYAKHLVSPHQGFLNGEVDCDSGIKFAALGLATQGIKSWDILILANSHDLHHNIAAYQDPTTLFWGSLAKSRDPNLLGKPASFNSPFSLVMSYFDDYLSSYEQYQGERTMIGYTDLIDILELADIDDLLALGENPERVLKLHQNFTNNVGWINVLDGKYRYPVLFDENEDVILM